MLLLPFSVNDFCDVTNRFQQILFGLNTMGYRESQRTACGKNADIEVCFGSGENTPAK
jgi:hypothetical protein